MSEAEFRELKKGDHVIYLGPKKNYGYVVPGSVFEVVRVGSAGFKIQLDNETTIGVRLDKYDGIHFASWYKILPREQGDKTDLTHIDYATMMDIALDINDLKWAKKIHEKAYKNNDF